MNQEFGCSMNSGLTRQPKLIYFVLCCLAISCVAALEGTAETVSRKGFIRKITGNDYKQFGYQHLGCKKDGTLVEVVREGIFSSAKRVEGRTVKQKT